VKTGASSPAVGRIVFYRPHESIWFKNPVRAILKRQFLPHKYEALLDYALASKAEVCFSTSLFRSPGRKGLIRLLLEPLEILLWCSLNGIALRRVRLLLSSRSLSAADVIILMHYGSFTHEEEKRAAAGKALAIHLSASPARKIVHMTHYAYHPQIGADNLRELGPSVLVAENDLWSNSAFYRQYFGSVPGEFWQLPYIASKRFEKTTPFKVRTNKLVATGSITYKMRAAEFTAFFRTDELQPLRRELHRNASLYEREMDCLISDLNASRTPSKPVTSGWKSVFKSLLTGPHPQADYYKRNIVSVYNEYTMFVVPEEVCNLPAIGFVEGMACGCAYFGLDDPMYSDLGMKAGIHYVTYDGTVEDLMAKVRFYQLPDNVSLLERIAERGCDFVNERLRAESVYSAFVDRLFSAPAIRASHV
jgi:hypothetical protein